MKMKKVLCIILALIMCFVLLAGCSNNNSTDKNETSHDEFGGSDQSGDNTSDGHLTADGKTVVNVGIGDTLTTVGPFEATTTARNAVLNALYQPLFMIFEGKICPVIGESYEYMDSTDGGATYPVRISIKDYVVDSNGNKFTAEDAKFCIEYCGENGFDEKSKYVDHLEVVDEYTLDVYFNVDASTMAGFFGDFACNLFMVTKAAWDASSDGMIADPVGTGPYKLKDFVGGSSCTLEVNENFWQKDKNDVVAIYGQNVDEIVYQFISDKSQIAIALQSGSIDMSNGVTTTDLVLFQDGGESADDFNIYQARANKTYYILFNCSDEERTGNLDLRMALSYCWDAQGIIDGAFNGQAYRVYAMEGHPGYSDYVLSWEDQDYFEYNTELAVEYFNKYLDATNQTADQVTIRLLGDSGQVGSSKIFEIYQAYVQNTLGTKCEIMYYESAVANDTWADPNGWDVYLSRAASSTNVVAAWVNRLSKTTSSWGTSTMGFVDDDHLEKILMTSWIEATHDEEHVSAVRDYVSEQCYMVGICGDYENIVYDNDVSKVVLDRKLFIAPGACEYNWN